MACIKTPSPGHRAIVRSCAVLAAIALVWACGGDSPVTPPAPPTPPPEPPARPTTLIVSPATAELTALGATVQLTVEVRDQNAQVMAGAAVTWSSSDPSVATVDASGLVIGVGEGMATITASAGSATGSAAVTVSQPVVSVEISPSAETVGLGDTLQLTAEGFDESADVVEGAQFSWESSDVAVARVDAEGLVTGVAGGTATITASAGTGQGTAEITVVDLQRAALVAFYEATGGPNWINSANWLTDAPLGEWFGVETDASGQVIRLAMSYYDAQSGEWISNNASGPVPAELGDLTALRSLEFFDNRLSGPIPPELGNLTRLTSLDFGSNDLSGPIPAELGGLSSLNYLYLYNNNFSGPVPRELGGLSDLTLLWLHGNDLEGPIPESFLELRRLEDFQFQANAGLCAPDTTEFAAWLEGIGNTSGPYCKQPDPQRAVLVAFYEATGGPDWINSENWLTDAPLGEWFGVETDASGQVIGLAMSYHDAQSGEWISNNVSGPIPAELGDLTALRSLEFFNNRLSGPIPPELGNLTRLTNLDFNSNDLSGPIPAELGDLSSLNYLRLNHNDFSGSVPRELGGLSDLTLLWLQANDLEGPIPESFLELGGLEDFQFQASADLCAPGTTEFVAWLDRIEYTSGPYCNESDVNVLNLLYEASGGTDWTRSDGWLETPALDAWHGVTSDALGRVVTLDLADNGLEGRLPAGLGSLAEMTALRVGGNALSGRLPLALAKSRLVELHYADTGLCVPAEPSFQAWLSGLPSHEGTDMECGLPSDREVLVALYETTHGPSWVNSENWLTDAPLGEWYGVDTDASGRVVALDLFGNDLAGPIPPELGNLANLQSLGMARNDLTGPIPAELANLAGLKRLHLSENELSGAIPAELGRLTGLRWLRLSDNGLTGPIPPELANLPDLYTLNLNSNGLVGPIPPELGVLASLELLYLAGNGLTGPIPPDLGNISRLRVLELAGNSLAGALPPELTGIPSLQELSLGNNPGLSGPLPAGLTDLRLETLLAGGTDLCAPSDPDFQDWLATVYQRRIVTCAGGSGAVAYLTQAVQSRDHPVPLVAGERALLRVFPTAAHPTTAGIPPVRARFYLNGTEIHLTEIAAKPIPIPTEVLESDLSVSANAEVPAEVVQPGLEVVVEIDPDGTLDPGLGVGKRIPETGRTAVEVHEMPVFDLTVIPFLWSADPNREVVQAAEAMEADPGEHELLWDTRTLLPIAELEVTAHEPVMSSSNNKNLLLAETVAIRVLEGGSGHYMGMMSGPVNPGGGVALLGGRANFSEPNASVIAHELGHNLNLRHAPCGNALQRDLSFPYTDGSIGAWGYDFRDGGRLVRPEYRDLMSYCEPEWVSDYHFTNALRFRFHDERPATIAIRTPQEAESLLLWGGTDAEGEPFLNPAFVIHASPAVPDATGDYRITGRTTGGDELFSVDFAMPVVADGDGSSSFAFVLPVQSGWAGSLADITLSGPGGSTTLDSDTDIPMTILLDPSTGEVRGILRDVSQADTAALAPPAGPDSLDVLFSRGIPGAEAWGR